MGFVIHFYIIFGTNLLTQRPSPDCCFLPISGFCRKGISNGVQTEWNLRERDFLNEQDPGDLDPTWRKKIGGHEVGGRAQGGRRAPTLVGPLWLHRPTSFTYIYSYTLKTSESTTKPYIHRRNLLYPRDPILGPVPELRRRGHQSRRASTSSSKPLRWSVSSLLPTYGSTASS